jgi:autotransporter-associated beta strand protein
MFSTRSLKKLRWSAVVFTLAWVICTMPFSARGAWYKGNTHDHSTDSDGDSAPEVVTAWYKDHGYNFLVLSDHNVFNPAKFATLSSTYNAPGSFLMVPGEEITTSFGGKAVHMNAINIGQVIAPVSQTSVATTINMNLANVAQQAAALNRPIIAHINHPNWNSYSITPQDLAQAVGTPYFELANCHSSGINHYGDATHPGMEKVWDIANTIRLNAGSAPMFGMATDDAHNFTTFGPGSTNPGRGFVMVDAADLSAASLLGAMDQGNFYASTGVTLTTLDYNAATSTLNVAVEPETGVTYYVDFIGTPKGTDPAKNPDGSYSVNVGKVLLSVAATPANSYTTSYNFDGTELYVRAHVRSSKNMDNPCTGGVQKEEAWTQPVGYVLVPQPPPLPDPLQYHAVAANLVAGGAAIPANPPGNTFSDLTVTQSGTPTVGTLQVNRGDFEISVGGSGLTYSQGILLASVTQNVRDTVRGTVEAGRNSYSDGLLALSVTQAAKSASTVVEANFNVSTAWFNYVGGWQAAHITATTGVIASANGVTASMISKTDIGRFTLNLGTTNTPNNGMLFTIGSNNGNAIVPTGVLANGWDVRIQTNASDFSAASVDKDFSFIYLPYTTNNLIGGRYDGANNSHFASVGDFTMEKITTGQYRLSIPSQTSATGMLILTVSRETTIGSVTAPDDNFLTYEYDGAGHFLINSFDILPSLTTNGTAGLGMNFEDTHFVWAFVNFTQPLALPNFIWNKPAGGNWHTASNWSANTAASAPGLAVEFIHPISAAGITLDASATVGKMVFNSAADYKIQGAATLTLARGSLPANRIEVVQGNHEIAVPILLNDATEVDIAAGKSLTLSGIVGGANPLTKSGNGLLVLAANNGYTGVTTVSSGTLKLSENGQISDSASIVNNAAFLIETGTHSTHAITGSGTTQIRGAGSLTTPSIVQSALIIDTAPANAVPEPAAILSLVLAAIAAELAVAKRQFAAIRKAARLFKDFTHRTLNN